MLFIFGLSLAFGLIVLIDLPGLLKTGKRFRTLFIYFFFILVGFTLSFLQIIDKAPTSPAVIIKKVIEFMLGR